MTPLADIGHMAEQVGLYGVRIKMTVIKNMNSWNECISAWSNDDDDDDNDDFFSLPMYPNGKEYRKDPLFLS